MTTETLERSVGTDVSRIKVDGMSPGELNPSTLTPEKVGKRAGLSARMYGEQRLYSHNHCQYQRCT